MAEENRTESRTMAMIAVIAAVVLLSVVLIVLNIMLEWEHWAIPIIAFGAVACVGTYVLGRLTGRTALYIYSTILIIEVFYYNVNISSTYDSTPVIVLMLVILALTQESWLPWIGFVATYLGVLYGLILQNERGAIVFDVNNVVRIAWHLIIIWIAVITVEMLLKSIKRIEEGLKKRIGVLENENQAASDFLTNVSHEIRTPVNAIMGLTGLVMENETNDVNLERLQSVYDAGSRVSEQISDIMDYSEIEMNRIAVNEEDYMMSSLLSDLSVRLAPHMKKGVEVIIDVDMSMPAVMRTDVAKLKKIMLHLIVNGIKFTRQGAVYVNVAYDKKPYGVNLNVSVTDTGIGMDMKQKERSLSRFYQADSMRTRASGGLGLGLPIVIGFLQALGGFASVDSIPGSGTTMRFSVPQKVINPGKSISIDNRENTCLAAFFAFHTIQNPQIREFYNRFMRNFITPLHVTTHRVETIDSLKKVVSKVFFTHVFTGAWEYENYTDYIESLTDKCIVCVIADPDLKLRYGSRVRIIKKPLYGYPLVNALNNELIDDASKGDLYLPGVKALVVDDEPMNLTVATGLFEKYGMIITTAGSGQEAVEICSSQDFDIVFMDHMMPGMDGVEAMKIIRSEARHRGVEYPFVALTANALSSAREMFIKEGFDGFVSKPVDLVEFERVVKNLLPKAAISYREKVPVDKKTAGERLKGGLSSLGIDVSEGMRYSEDDEDFYKVLLKQFAGEAVDKHERAENFLSDNNLDEYAVIVHSIKSTAKMIGADMLSEKARLMEMAAKEGNLSKVQEGHEGLFSKYEETAKGIGEILGEDISKNEIVGAESIMPRGAAMFEFLPKGGMS